ncbi:uncharacterized protein LOC132624254 [Lycium barbarum]|uniref:uncharacterized protein LOC132624254 n=1 Tax=Lycium barbarum TaxID=112863 RepID=UPI00293EF66D|nr:uncharacterized protein LOC132624254 [Lycium barbarum]
MSHAFAEFYGQCSNNMTEALAIWKGINICKDNGFRNVMVESDSLMVINMIKEKLKPPWQLTEIIVKIQRLTRHGDFEFKHIYREGNSTADLFANLGEDSKTSTIFTEASLLPAKVIALMKLELDGLPNFRFRSKRNKFISNGS